MEISKNIIFDNEILKKKEENELSIRQLEIASLNLDDFNQRLNSNIKLTYNSQYKSFFPTSRDEKFDNLIARYIAHLLSYYKNRNDWNEANFIDYNISLIRHEFEDLYLSIKEIGKDYSHNSGLRQRLSLFIKRYDDYYPFGIFTDEGQQLYKSELQKMVNSLKILETSLID